MLETIREYALDQLAQLGGAGEIWRRHMDYYLALAEAAESELRGSNQAEWLARLEREHDNLRAALGWSLQHGQIEKSLRLGGALWYFWFWHSHLSEGRMWLEGALAAALGSVIPPAVRAKALCGAGTLARVQGDYRRALNLLEGSLEVWRELGDKRGIALALNCLGTTTYNQGNLEQAAQYGEESLALCRELSDLWGIASALNSLGELARCEGDYTQAQSLYQESLALRRTLGNKIGTAVTLHNLGHVALYREDHIQAGALFSEALSVAHEIGDAQCIAECLTGLAGVLVAKKIVLDAARLFGAAEGLLDAIGAGLEPADRAGRDKSLSAARNDSVDEAAFVAAWAEGRAMTLEQAVEFALENVVDA
jgi:tetratricopeptide (TPR) repeat protein